MVLMRGYRGLVMLAITMAIVLGVTLPAAAQATATVAGTVKDAQGGIIPGATITLVSESRGTTFETQSGATGDFVIPNVPGDTYTIRVAMDGFKTSERKGIAASPGDRVAIGTVTVEVGTLAETVLVTGDAPMIQAQTGDRSFVVTKESVENLPMSGRNYASFAALTPGVQVSGTAAVRLDGARTNYMLDGISNVNTGGNQQGIQLSPDAIAEVKVISSAYQAEYGRSTGIQIAGVTKSGSNQFRGSVFDLERNSDWNSNAWANVQNKIAKAVSKQRDWGYTFGGPVGKPGGKNKLFFFYSEQFSPRKAGGTINQVRVPTLLERQGDFSQSTDNTGALFNLIRDSTTGLPCTATDTRGCFQDGGVLGKIPADRLYGLGLNILKQYPAPNIAGLNYNLQTVVPNTTTNTYQHVIRMDYQLSSRLRISAKYAGENRKKFPIYGAIPGFNDLIFQFPTTYVPSATVDYTLNNTTVVEGTWGFTRGDLGNTPISPASNRNNIGLADFPYLFPHAGIVPSDFYQYKNLAAAGAPSLVNGEILTPPLFSWGSRIANAPPNNAFPTFLCYQYTKDLSLSVTKLWGAHTLKAGYQSQDSLKVQNLGTGGALQFGGTVSFANDSNNPLDSGFGFSNAALGVFQSFTQENKLYEGIYRYHNKDAYLQDNWKLTSKLTLDAGMRFTHHGPQYDTKQQSSNFFPTQWSLSKAPVLYVPGCSVATSPCPSASRVAVNPLTGVSQGPGSFVAIATVVPNSGTLANGIIQAGHGIAKENYTEPNMALGPRVGVAYDLSGTQRMVFRGSVGLFYDRLQGDSIFNQIGNTPNGLGGALFNSTLQSVAAGTTALIPAPSQTVYYYDAKIGSSVNWNAGMQMVLPWSSSLDVSYVGSHNYNSAAFGTVGLPAVPAGATANLIVDQNAPDLGTAYLPQFQDSTLAASAIPGASALVTDLIRPYRGIGAINTTWPRFHTQFDSLQTAYSRRFRNGWQAGLAWTLSLRNKGNILSPPHFKHNADGTFSDDPTQAATDEIVSNAGIRRNLLKVNFVWDLPDVKGSSGAAKVLEGLVNGWQLSGVYSGGPLAQYDAYYSYQSGGSNVNLTGSPNYPARIKVVGDTGGGCDSQYAQFKATSFQGPNYNSVGNESGANLLNGCNDHTLDLAVSRSISLGGNRQMQLRLDAFNVLNAIVISARQQVIQYNSPADPTTIRNNEYNADGTINAARLTPLTAGAGAATAAQTMRSLQAQIRFTF
jgi:Carboxypeptidase regulatory-like domain/TonB-dependent Receptor Plug Domain